MLARAAAAGADDERRSLHPEIFERRRFLQLARLEGHRRVLGDSLAYESSAALRAVVGGLRVLEAALGAVDVAHLAR
jgi:hypothetical protein